MRSARYVLGSGLSVICLAASATTALAANKRPIVTLTRAQGKSMDKTYYNCDHLGQYGCLRMYCQQAKLSRQDAIEIQYLYRNIWNDFPEFHSPELRACFVRAGGRFQ